MARAAKAEEAEFVVHHSKLARLAHPAAKAGQRVVRDGAACQLLDPPAALADQMGVMPGELLPQLVPKAAAGIVYSPQKACCLQQVNRPVDGDAVDPLSRHPGVNVLDREWTVAPADGLQNRAARPRQPVTLSGERVVKRAPRSSR